MSVNAVIAECVSVVTDMTVPGFNRPLQVKTGPPVVMPIRVAPVLFIWPSSFPWKRQTNPRAKPADLSTGGFIKRTYEINMWLDCSFLPSNANRTTQFFQIVEQIIGAFTNTESNIILTDPITEAQSQLLAIAEKGQATVAIDHTTLDKRQIISSAGLKIQVEEAAQG